MSELDRWHNILGGFDWHRIRTDFESLHKQAEDAGFELKIIDEQCPCCSFRPCFQMKERRLKKPRRGDVTVNTAKEKEL
jgi:hypothetical protein